jgi:[CysO sulfur-carrier protein]-S-L-cysteine hydrolase
MNAPKEIFLTQETWNEISRHSQEAFPEECCGLVLSNGVKDQVRRLENIQNKLHALDPITYPRTAAIAYAMDPRELQSILDNAGKAGAELKAFYHSHPDHEAYFSAEDKAFATPFGEPTFPGAAQIVTSVFNRVVKDIKAFAWSDEKKDFVELPIRKI